jgi:hypothetical protein
LWRRPRRKLGCGAKEGRKEGRKERKEGNSFMDFLNMFESSVPIKYKYI